MMSVLIGVFAAAHAVRGWRRGLVAEVVELVGLGVAALAAFATWPVFQILLSGWAAALAGVGIFAAVGFVAAVLARRVGRSLAGSVVRSRFADGVGGSLFALTWGLLLVTSVLILAANAPVARARVARPICESAVARTLISGANPLHGGGERLALLGRPVILWISQRIADGLMLSHSGVLCSPDAQGDERAPGHGAFTFPGVGADEVAVAPAEEEEVLRRLNDARRDAGLGPVVVDEALRAVGRQYARQMYVEGFFAHETPPCWEGGASAPGCTDPFDRMRAGGVSYRTAGENLALAPTPAAAHDGLMKSPGHRANILNPDYTRVGIGVYRGPYGLMITQEFAG